MQPNYLADLQRQLNEIRRLQLQHDVDIKRLWGLQSAQGPGWPVGGDVPPLPLGGPWNTTTSSTSSTSSTTTAAETCSECWEATFAGVSCSFVNATWTLHFNAGASTGFTKTWDDIADAYNVRLQYLDPFAGAWVLIVDSGGSLATYRTTGRYCDGGSITLALENPGFDCTGWPATVTVTPIACPPPSSSSSSSSSSTAGSTTTAGSSTTAATTTTSGSSTTAESSTTADSSTTSDGSSSTSGSSTTIDACGGGSCTYEVIDGGGGVHQWVQISFDCEGPCGCEEASLPDPASFAIGATASVGCISL